MREIMQKRYRDKMYKEKIWGNINQSGNHVLNLVTEGIDKKMDKGSSEEMWMHSVSCFLSLWTDLSEPPASPVSVWVVSSELLPWRWAPRAVWFFVFCFLHEVIEIQNIIFFENLIFSIKSDGKTSSPSASNF